MADLALDADALAQRVLAQFEHCGSVERAHERQPELAREVRISLDESMGSIEKGGQAAAVVQGASVHDVEAVGRRGGRPAGNWARSNPFATTPKRSGGRSAYCARKASAIRSVTSTTRSAACMTADSRRRSRPSRQRG